MNNIHYLPGKDHHWIQTLQKYNFKQTWDRSQTGEGNVIIEIFNHIPTYNRGVCVEFGACDGKMKSNTLVMEQYHYWKRYLFDVKPLSEDVIEANITAENINDVFKDAGVPQDLDLLSIDINGNDYWVWKALEYTPSVVVIEYNQNAGYKEAKVVPYDPNFQFDRTTYFGASLPAMKILGNKKGYDLVYFNGLNGFFIRKDLIPGAPKITFKGIVQNKPGWPRDPHNRFWMVIQP